MRKLEKDQIDRQRWADAGGNIGGENRLDRALWGHDPENFSQYSAQ